MNFAPLKIRVGGKTLAVRSSQGEPECRIDVVGRVFGRERAMREFAHQAAAAGKRVAVVRPGKVEVIEPAPKEREPPMSAAIASLVGLVATLGCLPDRRRA